MKPGGAKIKGDRGEREALAKHREVMPHLLVRGADRAKNAGQPHDRGDLSVFDDQAVQVKYFKRDNLGAAVRQAAYGAQEQASNAYKELGAGLSIVDGQRKTSTRILASYTPNMAEKLGIEPVVEFGIISQLLAWVSTDEPPKGFLAYPRHARWARLASEPAVIVGTFEAYAAAYEQWRMLNGAQTATPDRSEPSHAA